MHLTEQERQEINGLVAEVEAASGARFVAAVIGKADAYPEILQKASALGAAMAGSLIAVIGLLRTDWVPPHAIALALMIVLGYRMTCPAATIFVPAIARLFLANLRAEVEVEPHARARFLDGGMSQTQYWVGVLIPDQPD